MSAQSDFTHGIDSGYHNRQLVANFAYIFNFFDTLTVKLGYMDHAIRTGEDFHKSTKICSAYDFTGIYSSQLWCLSDRLDPLASLFCTFPVHRCDVNSSVFFDVNFCSGFLLERTDIFPSWPYDRTDFIRWDFNYCDAGNVRL